MPLGVQVRYFKLEEKVPKRAIEIKMLKEVAEGVCMFESLFIENMVMVETIIVVFVWWMENRPRKG